MPDAAAYFRGLSALEFLVDERVLLSASAALVERDCSTCHGGNVGLLGVLAEQGGARIAATGNRSQAECSPAVG